MVKSTPLGVTEVAIPIIMANLIAFLRTLHLRLRANPTA